MKLLKLLTAGLAMSLCFISCKKKDAAPVYPDYTQLKVGNYWIYERFLIDTAGNESPYSNTGPTYDSCFVEKDTVMSGKTYFKLWRTNAIGIPYCSFLRDSLSYTIDQYGLIVF